MSATNIVDDPDGMFLPDMRSARLEAVRSARDHHGRGLAARTAPPSSWIEVTDEQGEAIFALPFAEAVEINR